MGEHVTYKCCCVQVNNVFVGLSHCCYASSLPGVGGAVYLITLCVPVCVSVGVPSGFTPCQCDNPGCGSAIIGSILDELGERSMATFSLIYFCSVTYQRSHVEIPLLSQLIQAVAWPFLL